MLKKQLNYVSISCESCCHLAFSLACISLWRWHQAVLLKTLLCFSHRLAQSLKKIENKVLSFCKILMFGGLLFFW